jgi:hypothetical protein
MPHTTRTKKASTSAEDRISSLPDDVLQHVLGFLPAVDAVHTSALARRWRYLWKSMRCLRIEYDGRYDSDSDSDIDDFVIKFINCLLLLRDPSCTLDKVELHCELNHDTPYVNIWIQHALLCQAQMLSIYFTSVDWYYDLDFPPLVSRHLIRLELRNVDLVVNDLDFSSCPALDVLKIKDCFIRSGRILSQSVKHLIIKDCVFESEKGVQKHLISVPNVILLKYMLLA